MIGVQVDKDLEIYKSLVNLFTEYVSVFSTSRAEKVLDYLINSGLKVIPDDSLAQEILLYMLNSKNSVPIKVLELLNLKFSDLPLNLRPRYQEGFEVKNAFWKVGNDISDSVFSLITIVDENSCQRFWCDSNGNKVELLNNSISRIG